MIRRVLLFSGAIGMGASVAACNGGAASPPSLGSTGIAAPAAAQRAALQSALLAVQFGALARPGGGPLVLSRRRAAAQRTALDVACTAGYSEADTNPGQTTHTVQSLYYDAGCTQLREVVTIDHTSTHMAIFNVANGTAVMYDHSGNAVDFQTIAFTYNMGTEQLQTTDARTAGGTPFSSATMTCSVQSDRLCPVAVTISGRGFDSGAVIAFSYPPQSDTATVQITPYSGAPGTLVLAPQDFFAPAVTGGTALAPLTGTVTTALKPTWPFDDYTIALSLSGGSEHIAASLSNGITTLQDGSATVTVDANGNGSIRYANGFVEQVIDYRDVG